MSIDPCVIRNYCSADLDQYVRLHSEAKSICHSKDTFLLASLRGESLEPVEFSNENLFLAEEHGKIVGACRVVPELAIDRVVLRLFIIPYFLGGGIDAGLIRSALKRAGDLGVARVHADLREDEEAACNLFAGLGFRPVRRYTEMKLDIERASVIESRHEGLSHRSLELGEEGEFTRLQNLAFGRSWGFCPNTVSEIVQQLNAPGYGHDGVIVAYHGELAVGYCWTAEVRPPNEKGKAVTGRIHMMGVAPEFRGRGVGKYVLRIGLERLASKGIRIVELTVDNENEAAVSLYRGGGFRPKTAVVWYEKKMK